MNLSPTPPLAMPSPIRIVHIPGLCLRPFRIKDAKRLAKLAGVSSVVRYTLGIPLPYSVEAAHDWIVGLAARFEGGIELIYALSLRGHLVGSIGLTFEAEHQRAEIGYWLGEPYRGRGLTRAAVAALCDFAFMAHNLTRIYGLCFPDNSASHAVLRAAGFRREGKLRSHIVKDGRALDALVFGLTRPKHRKPKSLC
jgi:[ribosomal protein S5]-alanine N-acetyltransferase